MPPVIAAEILCMSKVAALFDMHAPCSGGDDDVVDDPNDDDADDDPPY